MTFKKLRRLIGLSLVETAVVLGIVGLVAGGIWVATGSVRTKQRYDNAYHEGLRVTAAIARVMKRSAFPDTNYATVGITQEAIDIGILPAGYKLVSISGLGVNAFVSPAGLTGMVFLSRLPSGPVIGYSLLTQTATGDEKGLDNAGCMQMVARFVQSDSRIVPEVWVSRVSDLRYEVFTLPASIMGYSKCPNNATLVTMLVRP